MPYWIFYYKWNYTYAQTLNKPYLCQIYLKHNSSAHLVIESWIICELCSWNFFGIWLSLPHYRQHLCISLQWRHNDNDGVSNHQPSGCLLNRLFRRRSKKTSKLRVTGLCVGNSPGPWNPRTKGQLRGKCFHLMTSSWWNIRKWFAISFTIIPLLHDFSGKVFGEEIVYKCCRRGGHTLALLWVARSYKKTTSSGNLELNAL